MSSARIENNFVVIQPQATLAGLLSSPTPGSGAKAPHSSPMPSDFYIVVGVDDGRFVTVRNSVITQLASRLASAPNRTLAHDLLQRPLGELLSTMARAAVSQDDATSIREAQDDTAIIGGEKVIGIAVGKSVLTLDGLLAAIGINQNDLDRHGQRATRPDALDVPSGKGADNDVLPEVAEPQTPKREEIRLDTATPERVTVGAPFDLAVAIRQPSSPSLVLDDLKKLTSTIGSVYRVGDHTIKYRVEVEAKDCDVEPPSYLFYLEPKQDSIVQYFQLTPKHEGMLTIIVNAYQADDSALAASTRVRLQATLVVGDPSQPADHDAALKAYAVIQKLFTLDDLRDIAFRIGVAWDELSGDTLSVKAQSLLTFCGKHNLMQTLFDAINQARPEVQLKLDS